MEELTIVNFNINGWKKRKAEFEDFLAQTRPDIVGITETLLKGSECVKVSGYNTVNVNRRGARGGGVALLIAKKFSIGIVEIDTDVEQTTAVTEINGVKLKISVIYSRPNDVLRSADLDKLITDNTPTIVMGDWNAKHPAWGCNNVTKKGSALLE